MQRAAFDEELWRRRLRDARLRVTPVRLEVLRVMAGLSGPLNAQEVLAALPDGAADRVTVYRTLNSLVGADLARRTDPGDRVWRFSLADQKHEGHAHLVCDACGAVECLEDASIRVGSRGAGAQREVRITQSDVYLHGECEECAPPGAGAGKR